MKLSAGILCVVILAFCAMFFLSGCTGAEHILLAAGGAAATGGGVYVAKKLLSDLGPAVLGYAGREVAILGLRKLSPATAQTTANDLILATQDSITYLNTGVLPTADIINQIVSAKFQNLNPLILSEIENVAATLAQYVPSADVILNATEISCLVAFLQGMQDGAKDYLLNPQVTIKAKYTLSGEQTKASKKLKVSQYPLWFRAQPSKDVK